ncbi:hypothetical protein BJ878DRAFT_509002, partial [Calycina marina]
MSILPQQNPGMGPRTRYQYGKKSRGSSSTVASIFGAYAESAGVGEHRTLPRPVLEDVTSAISNLRLGTRNVSTVSTPENELVSKREPRKAPSDDASISPDEETSTAPKVRLTVSEHDKRNLNSDNVDEFAYPTALPERFQYSPTAPKAKVEHALKLNGNDTIQVCATDNISDVSFTSTEYDARRNESAEDSLGLLRNDSLFPELKPFLQAYKADCGAAVNICSWECFFPDDATVTKIAEATYSEVYQVSNKDGNSMIKVIRVKTTTDQDSLLIGNASTIANIASEVRIMNTMTTVDGFVGFKGANIVRGKCCDMIQEAHEEYNRNLSSRGVAVHTANEVPSAFQEPKSYTDNTVCLVIELSHAGHPLEMLRVVDTAQIWDIILGVTIALAKGEVTNQFEHRDLHENNIVYTTNAPDASVRDAQDVHKLGRSGIEVTLIDYGLSRATLATEEVVAFDMESDKEIFSSGPDKHPQFQCYRKMRTYLLTGERKAKPIAWHLDDRHDDPSKSWDMFIPYTNVVWLRYLLYQLRESYQLHGPTGTYQSTFRADKRTFNVEIEEFANMLGEASEGFESAEEALQYALTKEWIKRSDLNFEEGSWI